MTAEPFSEEEIVAFEKLGRFTVVGDYMQPFVDKLVATVVSQRQEIDRCERWIEDTKDATYNANLRIAELEVAGARALAQAERLQGRWSGRLSPGNEPLHATIAAQSRELETLRAALDRIRAWSHWWHEEARTQLRDTMKLIHEESVQALSPADPSLPPVEKMG